MAGTSFSLGLSTVKKKIEEKSEKNENERGSYLFTEDRSSSHLGMSNISAKSGGSLSLVQFLLNQSRRFACLAPRVLSSGILCETLEMLGQPPAEVVSPGAAWFRNAWTLSASRRRSWSLCTAFTSFSPGLSLRRTAPENRPSSVSVSWWAFRADVNCIKADTKSGCFVSDWSID